METLAGAPVGTVPADQASVTICARYSRPTQVATHASLPSASARTHHTICPTLAAKAVTPHVLRHTGVDISVIALWLGHENVTTTQIYLNADLALKQQALDRTTPLGASPGRYRPPDRLLAFLEDL